MAITAVAPLHTIWDCRWSRPGYRIPGVQDHLQPETLWVCVGTGERRAVSEEECAVCARWEELPTSGAN